MYLIRKQSVGQPAQLLTKRTCPLLLCLFSKVGITSFVQNIGAWLLLGLFWDTRTQTHSEILQGTHPLSRTHTCKMELQLCPGSVWLRRDNRPTWIRRSAWTLPKRVPPHHSLRGSVRLRDSRRRPQGREGWKEWKCNWIDWKAVKVAELLRYNSQLSCLEEQKQKLTFRILAVKSCREKQFLVPFVSNICFPVFHFCFSFLFSGPMVADGLWLLCLPQDMAPTHPAQR